MDSDLTSLLPSRKPAAFRHTCKRFNAVWNRRLNLFRRWAGAPWWTFDCRVDGDMRAAYEMYLPVRLFCRDLRRLAELRLPHPSWVPRLLVGALRDSHLDSPGFACRSMPDLWRQWPADLQGSVHMSDAACLRVCCCLADPPHYGTARGRYPQQAQQIRRCATRFQHGPLRLLDIGSGTGEGTADVVQSLHSHGVSAVQATAVTREPLETWMGTSGARPHRQRDDCRQGARESVTTPIRFLCGDARRLPLQEHFDLIVCNGLTGGTALQHPSDLAALASELKRLLAQNGVALIANRFHEGHRRCLQQFVADLRCRGWHTEGSLHALMLTRPRQAPPSRG